MLAMMYMVSVMGSTKLYSCIKGARQTLLGSTGRETIIALLESQTGSVFKQCQSLLLCPRLSRASNIAGIPVFGGKGARNLDWELFWIVFPGLMCPSSAGMDQAEEGL